MLISEYILRSIQMCDWNLFHLQVVNTTRDTLTNATVVAIAYDVDGNIPHQKVYKGLTIETKKTMIVAEIPLFKTINKQPVYFLLLKLITAERVHVSRNFYWLHPTPGNYRQLGQAFRSNKIDLTVATTSTIVENSYNIQVTLKNDKEIKVSYFSSKWDLPFLVWITGDALDSCGELTKRFFKIVVLTGQS